MTSATRRLIVRSGSPQPGHDRSALAASLADEWAVGARVVRHMASGAVVVEVPADRVLPMRSSTADLLIEEDQPLRHFAMPGLPPIAPVASDALLVRVRDESSRPLSDCSVYAIGGPVGFRAVTNARGEALVSADLRSVERIVVSPRANYWSALAPAPTSPMAPVDVVLQRLAPAALAARVHRLLGLDAAPQLSGRGVRVAIIDSGIAPVDGLEVVGGYNTLDGGDPTAWAVDEKGHGTHCAGVVAAHRGGASALRGIAPGASLYALKVFPGGFVSDLIEALDWCRAQGIDLVNMSLGSAQRSEALAAAIDAAVHAGIGIVAACGNDGGPVAFPAALPQVIAITAVGRFGSFPAASAHGLKVGRHRDWWGGLFDASFNNAGPEVLACAPGVAVVSTVPQGYAAWDGTSMAAPIACGLLARVLEAYPWLRVGDRRGVEALRWIVAAGCIDTGMPPAIQGRGLVNLPRMLGAAQAWAG